MRFYGWDYWQCLDQPIEAFWLLQRNIDRLLAEDAQRGFEMTLQASHGNAETTKAYQERLVREMGAVTVMKPKLERGKLHGLVL
jgi:hypothetical protein